MKKPVVFMFSGQGSQYFHMGKELYENHPRFKLWMDHCDEILLPLIGTSLVDVLYKKDNKTEAFDQILFTNPALLCVEFSLARVLMEMGIQPDYLLGYSLGEFSAAVISGAISLEDGIQLTVDYAKLLESKSEPAAMLAIISSDELAKESPELLERCWITGKNFDSNFVVSGLTEDILNLQKVLGEKNIVSQKLPVNYGFHTSLMDPIKQEFKSLVSGINVFPMRIPTISSLTSSEINDIDDDYLWNVVRQPVEFEKTIISMLDRGDFIFVDVGPSGSLATFVKYLLPENSQSLYLEAINQFGKNLSTINKLKSELITGVC
ncbi:MAG: acyltransferase domain-containing protein [Kangiellaceae bacterium]|nr:acyltransferase domain-containing protein [Kangiellaceae bacterium]MCW9018389.1 acyltransferase domain-containing protein [Kangiellaceae bacterium]